MTTVTLEFNLPKQSDRTWSTNMPSVQAAYLWKHPHPKATAVAIIDPRAPLATGDPVAVKCGTDVLFGRLTTKYPAQAKLFDILIKTIDGERLLKRFAERTDVQKIVAINYLSLA